MKASPEIIVGDLVNFLNNRGYTLSKSALKIFTEVELLCHRYDIAVLYHDFLLPLINNFSEFARIIDRNGGDSTSAIKWLEGALSAETGKRDKYKEITPYSEGRESASRRSIIERCIKMLKGNRTVISEIDIIYAIMELHEEDIPVFENGIWTDERLHTPYITLSHIMGEYSQYLWVNFEIIRRELHFQDGREYDVAVSFAGEDRDMARQLADSLKSAGCTVFYDEYYKSDLWGKDLYTYLTEIYTKKARFCLMLISTNYAKKHWTSLERKAAQERAFKESQEYILPLRLDDTEVPGILSTVGFIDLRNTNYQEVVALIKEKLAYYYSRQFN